MGAVTQCYYYVKLLSVRFKVQFSKKEGKPQKAFSLHELLASSWRKTKRSFLLF